MVQALADLAAGHLSFPVHCDVVPLVMTFLIGQLDRAPPVLGDTLSSLLLTPRAHLRLATRDSRPKEPETQRFETELRKDISSSNRLFTLGARWPSIGTPAWCHTGYDERPTGRGTVEGFHVFRFRSRTLYPSFIRLSGGWIGNYVSDDLSVHNTDNLAKTKKKRARSDWSVLLYLSSAANATLLHRLLDMQFLARRAGPKVGTCQRAA
ncbi:hypothetical protein BDV09DRAFT_18232 [Aspergillus tetrazonus]